MSAAETTTLAQRCYSCDGAGCEEGCGLRGGCEMAHAGPDSHKICQRCGGSGLHGQATAEIVDLDEFLAGDPPDYNDPPPETGDVDVVNQWLRRYRRILAADDRATIIANNEIGRIQLWLATEQESRRAEREWLERALGQYHRARLTRDPKAKTISLPNGTLTARAQQPEWEYRDEQAFVQWAIGNAPELLRGVDPADEAALLEWAHEHVPAQAPDKTAVKKTLSVPKNSAPGLEVLPHTDDGEVVPGVVVTIREPKFTIDVEGGAS